VYMYVCECVCVYMYVCMCVCVFLVSLALRSFRDSLSIILRNGILTQQKGRAKIKCSLKNCERG